MYKRLVVLVLAGLALAALPMTAAALGLDVEAKGGAGIGLGSSTNSAVTGAPLLSWGAGVGFDVYLFNAGPANLGLSAGAEYASHSVHDLIANGAGPGVDVAGDANHNFLYIPFGVVGNIPLGPVSFVVHAGGFAGYFLSGKTTNLTVGGVSQPDQTLDTTNTEQWEFGLHLAAGVDVPVMTGVSVSPAVQFDMGLTDASKGDVPNYTDTLWSLTVMVGIKYKAM